MQTRNPAVGFVGTGIMGEPMALRILSRGFPVTVWNRSAERTESLFNSGARVVSDCSDALRDVDVAVCMLNTASVIDEVLFARNACSAVPVEVMKRGATLVVMSSIPVETSKRHARILEDAGVNYVDAPVSGGESGAKAGRLTIMAGGEAAVVQGVRSVLETMGTVTHVGAVGMGQLAKLANQIIVGMTIGAVAEALLLAKRGGADPRAVRDALCGGFADSAVLRIHGERMQDEQFTPGAPAVYQLKDLQTAQGFANSLNIRLPLLATITKLFEEMCGTELAYLDHSALYAYLARTIENDEDLSAG